MEPNYLYNTNVSYIHSVTNNSNIDRVNIVIDLLTSNKLVESIKSNINYLQESI